MQREFSKMHNVFDTDGKVNIAGWSRNAVFEYNLEQSRTFGKHGERDCYFVNNNEVSLYLSVENLGKDFLIKIAVADLKRGGVMSDFVVKKTLFNRIELPESDRAELLYTDKRIQLQLTNSIDERVLKCDFIDFGGRKNLYFNISLKKSEGESLSELAPFERDRRYFYLKRFVPKFKASGVIRIGGLEYSLSELNSRAYFDWTRFSKPRKHDYQRLSADCVIDGKRVSLCLASRVGDNRYGNENCFFVDGKLTKLSQINVKNTNGRLNRPWYFRGGYSAVDITFKPFTVKGEPMYASMSKTNLFFGRLYGTINHTDYNKPIVLDNAQAHLILTEFWQKGRPLRSALIFVIYFFSVSLSGSLTIRANIAIVVKKQMRM